MARTDTEVMSARRIGGGFFGNLIPGLGGRREARREDVVARYMNEELDAKIGDGSSVNLQEALPEAYFNAARRIGEIGGAREAQQLYQEGLKAQVALEKHNADIARLRATPRGTSDAALERLDRIQETRTQEGRPLLTSEEQEKFIREFGMNSAESQRERFADADPTYRERTLEYNVEDTANRVSATQAIETLPEARKQAVAGAQGVEAIRGAVDMLNEGVRTGTAANLRQWFARTLATLGGMPVDEQAIVDNTDAYLGAISPLVFARVTALRPVTQEERGYVEQMAGGDIALTEGSIRKLLEIAYKASRRDIEAYGRNRSFLSGNETYGRAIEGAFAPVDMPGEVNFSKPLALPEGITEEDMQVTMQATGLTREQVIEEYNKRQKR